MGILDAVEQIWEVTADEEQGIVEVNTVQMIVVLRVSEVLPLCTLVLILFHQCISAILGVCHVIIRETRLNVGQSQLHFHRRVVLAATHGLQTVHHVLPHIVGEDVSFVKRAFEEHQREKDVGNLVTCAEPAGSVAAAAVVIDTDVPVSSIFAHGDVDGLTGAGEEWYFTEAHLRLQCVEPLTDGVTGLELLIECSVGRDVEYQRCIVFLKNILEKAFQRRETELLGVVALDAAFYGDGVGLEPVLGYCPRICLSQPQSIPAS